MKKLNLLLFCSVFMLGCQNHAVNHAAAAPVDLSTSTERWPKLQSQAMDPEVENKISVILQKMTLEEKVGQILQAEIQSLEPGDIKKYHLGSVLNGGGSMPYRKDKAPVDDWVKLYDELYAESMDTSDGGVAVPVIWGTDAVHGHNNVTGATLFPHNIGLGAAHNPALIKKIGRATAKEVRATGIDWVFAPTLAVAQNDAWGRTYESYSEDPALVARYASAMVEGLQGTLGSDSFVQGTHVLACAKHFLGDGGTTGGDDQGNAQVSEQTLIDVHNAGYPPAIHAGVQTIMASFSSWNGTKLHGHHYLLTEVLKNIMGFNGFVVGDWNGHGQVPGCTNESCAAAINAGVDLVMVPYDWRKMYANTLAQVRSGEITQARLDDAVRRILRVKFKGGLFAGKPSARIPETVVGSVGSSSHRALARRAVRESLVLLKNNNQLLPLAPKQNILVAGAGADSIPMQAGGWSITWQGTGTTNADFPGATSIYGGIKRAVDAAGGSVELAIDGNYLTKPDVAIVVFGEEPYAEGHGDRDTLEFEPGNKSSLALLEKLRKQNIPVVSIFLSGRPMWVNPELNASDAFIAAWLPGSEGAGIADVILRQKDGGARYDFTGRLSFSWPAKPLQTEANGPNYAVQPLFALGYGLSYDNPKNLPKFAENAPGVTQKGSGDIAFYVARPMQPWNVFVRNHERDQMVSGAYAELPTGDVKIQTTDKDVQEDALRLTWQDAWSARLEIKNGKPLDLTRFVEQGVVSFDLNVKAFPSASLNVEMVCGDSCQRRVSLTDYAKENAGKSWQSVKIAVACFQREGDSFNAVTEPFNIDAAGTGEIEVANVRFLQNTKANFNCPEYTELSTTPMPNSEFWAQSWWPQRHQAVSDKVQHNQYNLIFIGDSITQGWEEAGYNVWQKYYAPRNALNLGFSGDRTEHVLWRLEQGELAGQSPKAVVLMVGTNNTGHRMEAPRQTAKGIEAIVQQLKSRLPESKILLLGIFPREAEPTAPMRRMNEAVNQQIINLADEQQVIFLNINDTFLTAEGSLSSEVMPDLLHLNEASYALWAKAMEPTLVRLLQESAL